MMVVPCFDWKTISYLPQTFAGISCTTLWYGSLNSGAFGGYLYFAKEATLRALALIEIAAEKARTSQSETQLESDASDEADDSDLTDTEHQYADAPVLSSEHEHPENDNAFWFSGDPLDAYGAQLGCYGGTDSSDSEI